MCVCFIFHTCCSAQPPLKSRYSPPVPPLSAPLCAFVQHARPLLHRPAPPSAAVARAVLRRVLLPAKPGPAPPRSTGSALRCSSGGVLCVRCVVRACVVLCAAYCSPKNVCPFQVQVHVRWTGFLSKHFCGSPKSPARSSGRIAWLTDTVRQLFWN